MRRRRTDDLLRVAADARTAGIAVPGRADAVWEHIRSGWDPERIAWQRWLVRWWPWVVAVVLVTAAATAVMPHGAHDQTEPRPPELLGSGGMHRIPDSP